MIRWWKLAGGLSASMLLAASAWAGSAASDSRLAAAARITPPLAEKMAQAAPDELIPISIILTEQLSRDDLELIGRAAGGKAARRQAVIDALESVARDSQRGLLEMLGAEQSAGRVGPRIDSLWLVNAVGASATSEVIVRLAQRPEVDHINYDAPRGMEIFPFEPGQEQVLAAVECGVQLMQAPRVWSELGITGRGAVVAMIDTGACLTHPDLANQIWVNADEIPGNGIDDDANGFIDDINGWNFRENNNNVTDVNGHGTHTAGTVGGDGTQGTQTGMAPDVQLMILKINEFANPTGELSVWNAMQYGVRNGADAFSVSLGWRYVWNPDRPTWRRNCENAQAAGVVVIYAAGNEGNCCPPTSSTRCPGDVPSNITVGAVDCNDVLASFSSWGPVTWQNIPPYNDWPYPPGKPKPTISAPGVNTISTRNSCSGYTTLSGTSMATPHVAGTVALMLQANPCLSHATIKDILQVTSRDLGTPGRDNQYGAGRVDAYAAVQRARALRCMGDLDCDGAIGQSDLGQLLSCYNTGPCGDIDGDGDTDQADLGALLSVYGQVCAN